MCWKNEDELYNGGNAFKLTARDESGVIITIIADNYFGYCKKEVKTQISYAANLFGLTEEEHAGGALVFASYDLGEEFNGDVVSRRAPHSFVEMTKMFGGIMDVQPEGYAVDKKFPEIVYVPASARFDLQRQKIFWTHPTAASKTSGSRRKKPTSARPATRSAWKNRPATDASGGWSARWPRARSATSPARFPAAANRSFPSPSPTRFSPAGVRLGLEK